MSHMKWFENIIEQWVVVLMASTVRLLLDKVQKKHIDIFSVCLQYICWTLCWYIAYRMIQDWDMKILYISIIVLLSRDLAIFFVSKEWFEKIKNILFTVLWK